MKILKYLFGIIALCLLFSIGYMLYDAPLSPEFDAYFPDDPYIAKGNVYNDLVGLFAPDNTDNITAYGLDIIQNPQKFNQADQMDIELVHPNKRVCVSQDETHLNKDYCYSPKEIDAMLKKNAILLRRYQTIYNTDYEHYSVGDSAIHQHFRARKIHNVNALNLARMMSVPNTENTENALKDWIISTRWFQKLLAGKNYGIDQALLWDTYKSNLHALPLIINNDDTPESDLLNQYKDELIDLLSYDFTGNDSAHHAHATQSALKIWVQAKAEKTHPESMAAFVTNNLNIASRPSDAMISWDPYNESIAVAFKSGSETIKHYFYYMMVLSCVPEEDLFKMPRNDEFVTHQLNFFPLVTICISDLIPLGDALSDMISVSDYNANINIDKDSRVNFAARKTPIDVIIDQISRKANLHYEIDHDAKIISIRSQ